MANFTNQQPWIATEKDCDAPWSGYKHGKHFRCGLCGYKFKVGDTVRWVYAGKVRHTNFLVCTECDGEDVLEKRQKQYEEFQELKEGRFWDFFDDDTDFIEKDPHPTFEEFLSGLGMKL